MRYPPRPGQWIFTEKWILGFWFDKYLCQNLGRGSEFSGCFPQSFALCPQIEPFKDHFHCFNIFILISMAIDRLQSTTMLAKLFQNISYYFFTQNLSQIGNWRVSYEFWVNNYYKSVLISTIITHVSNVFTSALNS